MMKFTCTLQGEMPSKKNAWKRTGNGSVYIPADMKKEIDDFLWQIKGIKNRPREPIRGKVKISFVFHTKYPPRRDLDNITTTALDILQKAGVIENDRNVVELNAMKKESRESKVIITITEK